MWSMYNYFTCSIYSWSGRTSHCLQSSGRIQTHDQLIWSCQCSRTGQVIFDQIVDRINQRSGSWPRGSVWFCVLPLFLYFLFSSFGLFHLLLLSSFFLLQSLLFSFFLPYFLCPFSFSFSSPYICICFFFILSSSFPLKDKKEIKKMIIYL